MGTYFSAVFQMPRSHIVVFLLTLVGCVEVNIAWKLGFMGRFTQINGKLETHIAQNQLGHKPAPEVQWFEQKLDHFNPANTQTWKQRYAVQKNRYNGNEVIFLYLEGLESMHVRWLDFSAMDDYAKKYKAAKFILEHRFYGESKPTPDVSLDSLKYLNSEQALGDIAYFIAKMNTKHGFSNPKWVVFGGSYAGSLAAWVRYKYPHLVYAAISSSSPLLAKLDFSEYYESVSESLAVQFSTDCVDFIKTVTHKLTTGVTNATERREYQEFFGLCEPLEDNEKDHATFFEILADISVYMVQHGVDAISAYCGVLTDDLRIKCPVKRYAFVQKMLLNGALDTMDCFHYKYSALVQLYKQTSWNANTNPYRQWLYQVCTEFGSFPTSSTRESTFGDRFPAKYFVDLCSDVFGHTFDEAFLNRSIEATNTKYGGLSLAAERIVFVYGSLDPWSRLGITSNPPKGSHVIFVNGTAQCADMLPDSHFDPPELVDARRDVLEIIGSWLTGDQPRQK